MKIKLNSRRHNGGWWTWIPIFLVFGSPVYVTGSQWLAGWVIAQQVPDLSQIDWNAQ